jgi:hypothetical protein
MTDFLRRFLAIGLLAALAGAATLALAACVPGTEEPGFLSPVSPIAALPWLPTPEPASPFDRLFSASYWTSPLPWVAIGLVFFSAFAVALIYGLRLAHPAEDEREEPSGPTGWGP